MSNLFVFASDCAIFKQRNHDRYKSNRYHVRNITQRKYNKSEDPQGLAVLPLRTGFKQRLVESQIEV